ncbi:MAG: Ldh family oxidoreductase [Planctomycetales bacterium]|nr:Ldh family oxidoreductase [Planctomycetales bacterium]
MSENSGFPRITDEGYEKMPTFRAEQLGTVAKRVLEGAGASEQEASVVARELQGANLVGHDSHGVMRLMQYVDYIEKKVICPGQEMEILKEGDAFLLIDGHFNFGQVVASEALKLGKEKARQAGTATIFIRNCNHVGRLGSYTQQAALEKFAAMMVVNGPASGGVAPYGAIQGRMGTNPITIAAPWGDDAMVLDMTSSATAEGKVRVAFQKGVPVPEGQLIDAQGQPTTDPSTYYADPGGAILPLGGNLGFKGYGLSVMIDVFGGMLSGFGICRTDLPPGTNGVWMYLVDISAFTELDAYQELVAKYIAHIKAAERQPGVDEILMPGEIELRRRDQRLADGVEVPEETWRQISELADRLEVSLEGV